MFGLGTGELALILVILFFVFGAKRLQLSGRPWGRVCGILVARSKASMKRKKSPHRMKISQLIYPGSKKSSTSKIFVTMKLRPL